MQVQWKVAWIIERLFKNRTNTIHFQLPLSDWTLLKKHLPLLITHISSISITNNSGKKKGGGGLHKLNILKLFFIFIKCQKHTQKKNNHWNFSSISQSCSHNRLYVTTVLRTSFQGLWMTPKFKTEKIINDHASSFKRTSII